MRENLVPSLVAAVVLGATAFPALYTGLGAALPASQTIVFTPDRAADAPEPQSEAAGRREFVRHGLSFRESLSLPADAPGILDGSTRYRLTRDPHPLLFELAAGLSMLIGVGAGLAWNARTRRRQR